MTQSLAEQRWQWLQTDPSLTALCEASPQDWLVVRRELTQLFAQRDPAALKARVAVLSQRILPDPHFLSGERSGRAFERFVEQQLRQRMSELALRQYVLAQATGIKQGKVRFNLFNGLIAQKLLFKRDFVRKPVPLLWFRLLWPLLWQKRLLMPLVEKKGIYCFYSRELIDGLISLIGNRSCHEVAAGDGTLSRFLQEAGLAISASDNQSWALAGGDMVQNLDAISAIQRHQPAVVLCSWPPAGNDFEKQIFRQACVQTYIVIGSHSRFITGNWDEYEAQTVFSWRELPELSAKIVPPHIKAGVWMFERKSQF